ncbi:MAG: DUF3417 domain-containing protein, partial [Acidobacteria bacterium]|nr:DUF3417 domain-containing protein [Acidobacteriota bacterium]
MAYNLMWTWDDELRAVFRRVDRALWDQSYQNPVLMLGSVSQERLEELVNDDSFMSFFQRSYKRMREYLDEPTWWDKRYPEKPLVAYFSAEFGISESLPIYSGGLGVLSGDHMKGASDLGLPLAGVGLLYQQGYFRQYLTSDGWQQESYPTNDFYNLPVQQERGADGLPVKVEISIAGPRLLASKQTAQGLTQHTTRILAQLFLELFGDLFFVFLQRLFRFGLGETGHVWGIAGIVEGAVHLDRDRDTPEIGEFLAALPFGGRGQGRVQRIVDAFAHEIRLPLSGDPKQRRLHYQVLIADDTPVENQRARHLAKICFCVFDFADKACLRLSHQLTEIDADEGAVQKLESRLARERALDRIGTR